MLNYGEKLLVMTERNEGLPEKDHFVRYPASWITGEARELMRQMWEHLSGFKTTIQSDENEIKYVFRHDQPINKDENS